MHIFATFWDSFVSVLKTYNWWRDSIDILIVAYLIYKLIKLVRETRAEQLVKGILLLGGAFVVANVLELNVMSFLLKNIFSIGLFAIIVVFQPELRRALERVGRTKVKMRDLGVLGLSGESAQKAAEVWSNAIDVIGRSAQKLSRSKTGALIVIERQTRLGEQIATGVEINATPSVELFGNIFFPNTPLHDGAVIMRQGMVLAAACFLPKPQQEENLDRQLGSRHRAAIGMSENSDALIVVVSEETGTISLAENGRLTRGLTKETLEEILTKRLIPIDPVRSGEKKPRFWRGKKK